MTKPQSPWQIHLMKVFHEMRKKDSKIKLSDAMKKAKLSYHK